MNQRAQEARICTMYLNLTRSERAAIERLAEERGGTLSGVVRKLIRDAGALSKGVIANDEDHTEAANARVQ